MLKYSEITVRLHLKWQKILPFDVKNMFAIIKETAYDALYSITVKAVISSLS